MIYRWQAFSTMDTLARFLALYKPISDQLAIAGWVKSTETGEVDWATMGLPAANNAVFQIWKMGDSLQSTSPVYMKLRYFRGNVANACRLGVSLGTGSDGAGTLTGNLTGESICLDQNATTGTYTHHISAAPNRMQLELRSDLDIYNTMSISVERRKDSSGADLGDFTCLTYLAPGGSNVGFILLAKPSSGWTVTTRQSVPIAWTNLTIFIANGGAIMSPVFPIWGTVDYPLLGQMFLGNGDLSYLSEVKVTLYGTQHTYLVTGFAASGTNGMPNYCTRAFRWE